MMKIKSDKIVVGKELFDGYVYVLNGKIAEITKEDKPSDESYDFTGKYVSAGFIDIHTHGAGGYAFMNSSVEDVIAGCNFHLRHGTTSIVPTISAGEFQTMKNAVVNIDEAKKSGKAKGNILGAHLEGPYLSPKQAGAQCPAFITPPIKGEYESLVEEYGESIVRWTYAPENDENGAFCRYLTERGIIASAGHTDAKYPDMAVAIDNGCNLITHLYSCTSTVTRDHGFRSLGVIESAFLRDELYVEIIADGKHLPSDLIKMIIKIKGVDKVALITDSLEIAGTDVKEGVMSGTEFIVEDGVCKLKDRSAFAGSVATANRLIETLVKACGFDVPTAVKMLTETPAKILKINKGVLEKGYDADVVVFDGDFVVTDVFVGGKKAE
ncbi:MAG: N-acetylglucosamine-6-phosphate deacetylase [Clostridiales bacterium]|nr:N-acetylglucosamine-6-phosphate deacetylase [Clostridiales bacterium]